MTTNNSPRAVTAKALITPDGVISQPLILLNEGRIESLTTTAAHTALEGTLHLPETTLSSGFLDVHVHGAGGRDVMEGATDAIGTVAQVLAAHGTTRFLATTVTAGVDEILRALDTIATSIEAGPASQLAATPIGIHLEGPFLSHNKRGVHAPEKLQQPVIDLYDRFAEAARGHIHLMTIAPELPGALELIQYVSSKGVRVSLGHSDAVATEARAGIAAGAVSATHTFNAMRGLTQREPGMLGVVLDADKLYAELICDGIHTTPEAVRLWLRMKGLEHAILVTDGMAATGMPDGDYLLGDMLAHVENGVAMHDGALAGSVLTMDRAVANVQTFTGIDLPSAVRLASRNPAAMLGLPSASEWADFNLFDDAGRRTGTILRGQMLPT
ncbi:N-acetylglucosamine-6-phosphate deacetylase [Terriglobus roseus]|uniref:N-acetylglucosamine-6-phosphate deacetylase n=1 Tax=Terriglobus roseus TaxID=392734 RepID=A0A1H4TUJ2_9BACT|nr:N-acetylglucosamine-6-phosphate deacetylase [Terriglobus roseus]SEC60155.1 N-acetylglucosamine-6-phosphate deacetylase [Terriglobus roseus]